MTESLPDMKVMFSSDSLVKFTDTVEVSGSVVVDRGTDSRRTRIILACPLLCFTVMIFWISLAKSAVNDLFYCYAFCIEPIHFFLAIRESHSQSVVFILTRKYLYSEHLDV